MQLNDFVSKINAWVDENKDDVVQFLVDFIAKKSVTYNEKDAVEFYTNKMKEFGFDEVRIDKVGNALGRIGSGKTVILYDAHIDTVEPGDAAAWGQDPLKAEVKNGEVWGRGAVDDKACLTGFAFAGKAMKALGLTADFTLWVSGSLSEEDVEGSCVKAMMEENPDIKPEYILVGEPSENRLVRGHKGRALIRITVPGKAAHASAAHMGDNALTKALPMIDSIDKFQDFTEDPFLGKGTIEVTYVECNTPSLNTVPGEVTVVCDRRISCGETSEDLIKEMQQHLAKAPGAQAAIDTESVTTYTGYEISCEDYFPSWVMPEDHKIVQSGVAAYKAVYGKEPVVGKWDFCTNATSLCGRTGIPALGFGPGDEELCHSSEDRVPVDELVEAVKFYAAFPFALVQG